MPHPILEIHFEDTRRQFASVVKNWYHRPLVGDYIELTDDTGPIMVGRVVSVGWVNGPHGEYLDVRIK